ncbi:hypothetical protein [Rothia sp. ZJ1223]|uniref:hypothetical protein n=1 Tax=Rothia sp. ZJ1223 TaxID=2811098 RepID=UPI00195D4C21|nr:hypothetical protein [Rothia sp. ZJ1223]MBM7051315.1 hypothetical protein [Rothia sp. ZJ1223]
MRFLTWGAVIATVVAVVFALLGFSAVGQQNKVYESLSGERTIAQHMLAVQAHGDLSDEQDQIVQDALEQLPEAAVEQARQQPADSQVSSQELFERLVAASLEAQTPQQRVFTAQTAHSWLSATQETDEELSRETIDEAFKHERVGQCEVTEETGASGAEADQMQAVSTVDALAQSLYSLKYYAEVSSARADFAGYTAEEAAALEDAGHYARQVLTELEAELNCTDHSPTQRPSYVLDNGAVTNALATYHGVIDQNLLAVLADPAFNDASDVHLIALDALLRA